MKKSLLAVVLMLAGVVHAQQHPLFKDADLALGEKLIADNKCEECHKRRAGGDGSDIYNPKGRINTAGSLRGMVEYCNTELNLGFFPEDTTAVAAVLNKRHYKFK
jgi:cytochrome c2